MSPIESNRTESNRRPVSGGPRIPDRLRSFLRLPLTLAILALTAMTAAVLFGDTMPVLSLFQHFAAALAVLSLFCMLAALVFGMRRWAALAAVLMLWHGFTVLPFLAPTGPAVSGPPLKVLSLNLWNKSRDHGKTVDYLLASGADVIGTVETTEAWRAALKPLESIYPYHLDCVGTVFRCGVALYSKLPFTASFADRIDGALPAVVWGTIDWRGRPLTLAALQLVDPLVGMRRGLQAQQAAVVDGYFGALPGDLIVMGDFNSAPWSALQTRFRAATGLDNHGRLAFTWPRWAPAIFRLPIDQIFARGDLAVRDFHAGPPVDSDHLPVLADIYRTAP